MEAPYTEKIGEARTGFTLVELCISMALIAIIATLAIPSFFGRSEITLENAAELFASDLRSAQNRAAFLDREVEVHFMEDGVGYWIGDTINADSQSIEPSAWRNYSSNAVFQGVTITDFQLESGTRLSYGKRGMPTTAARITLSFKSDSRTITVAALNGKLAIEGSLTGWVDRGY